MLTNLFWLLTVLAIAVGFPIMVLYLFRVRQFQKLIQRLAPPVYKAMGEPLFPFDSSIRNSQTFLRFITSKQYQELEMPQVTIQGDALLKLYRVGMVINIIMFVSFFSALLSSKSW
jgi:hypothetical protein